MELPLDPRLPLGGIALILLLVWLTGGRRQPPPLDMAGARALLSAPELGFAAVDVALGTDGRGAVARDDQGRLAVIFAHGGRWAVHVAKAAELSPSVAGNELVLTRRRFPRRYWRIALGNAGAWA